jgi:hypothetical protein
MHSFGEGKYRSVEQTLGARLGRQDKAGCPASGTSFLNCCLHIVFARLGLDAARCGDGAADAILFVFKGTSAVARNLRKRRDRTAYADATISTLLYDNRIFLFPSTL